jgi:hypothetical protein
MKYPVLFYFAKARLWNFAKISRNKMKILRNTKVIFGAKFRIHPSHKRPRQLCTRATTTGRKGGKQLEGVRKSSIIFMRFRLSIEFNLIRIELL